MEGIPVFISNCTVPMPTGSRPLQSLHWRIRVLSPALHLRPAPSARFQQFGNGGKGIFQFRHPTPAAQGFRVRGPGLYPFLHERNGGRSPQHDFRTGGLRPRPVPKPGFQLPSTAPALTGHIGTLPSRPTRTPPERDALSFPQPGMTAPRTQALRRMRKHRIRNSEAQQS